MSERKGLFILLVLLFYGCGSNSSGRLLDAISAGRLDAVNRMILEGGDAHALDKELRTGLMLASNQGHREMVQFLLGLDPEPINRQDVNGWTALICAASRGHSGIVADLIRAGADPNIATRDGNTALMWASAGGYESSVSLLLAAGAKVDARNGLGWDAAYIAGRSGFAGLEAQLLEELNSRH